MPNMVKNQFFQKISIFWCFLTLFGMKFKKSSETLKNKNDATSEWVF